MSQMIEYVPGTLSVRAGEPMWSGKSKQGKRKQWVQSEKGVQQAKRFMLAESREGTGKRYWHAQGLVLSVPG